MTGRVVVGVDTSDRARLVLAWALEDATRRGIPLVVLHAYEIPVYGGIGMEAIPVADNETREAAEATIADLLAEVEPEGGFPVPVDGRAVQGHPGRVLIDECGVDDVLVVGNRGHGGFTGLLLGSVSTYCVHHAPCAVVVLRGGEHDDD